MVTFHVFINQGFIILAQCHFSRTVTKVVYCCRTKKGVSVVKSGIVVLRGLLTMTHLFRYLLSI